MAELSVHVGVDVGGTNTDAVVIQEGQVIGLTKQTTTDDVTTGVKQAICYALQNATKEGKKLRVQRVHIGTTHFVNAVVERRHLAPVAIIRLCGPASTDLPPFVDFPKQLQQVIGGPVYLVDGGYHFDGRLIRQVKEEEILAAVADMKEKGISNVIVSGVFSPSVPDQEIQVAKLVEDNYPGVSVTLSHHIAHLGILLRENAAILNESLKPLAKRTIQAFEEALRQLGLDCPFYLTQNDGTLISAEDSMKTPVYTFASGTTNSMRGAAFLSGVLDGVVVDIGGTSTDCGILNDGFPRPAAVKVKVGGVNTNFRMPDVISIGLGGGSLVKEEKGKVSIGPQSVGSQLEKKARVFGGDTLTASDIAVAAKLVSDMGTQPQNVSSLDQQFVDKCVQKIRAMVEDIIDQMKVSNVDVPVVLVGGGSVLIDSSKPLKGSSNTVIPRHYGVANAVGAALSQVSGNVDVLESLSNTSREAVIQQAKDRAREAAVANGAQRHTIEINDVMEVPLSYVPGNVTRVRVRAVGDLSMEGGGCLWDPTPEMLAPHTQQYAEEKLMGVGGHDEDEVTETEPYINPETGEWILSEWDIECLSVGAGILGCGGGGNPHNGKLLARKVLRDGHTIRIITPERHRTTHSSDDLVVPLFGIGSPTIGIETIRTIRTFDVALLCMLELLDGCVSSPLANITDTSKMKGILYIDDLRTEEEDEGSPDKDAQRIREHISALLCAEIGGANCMTALVEGGVNGLSVLDADCMGRAFPELQHCTPLIYGHPPYPASLGSIDGQRAAVIYVDSGKNLENHLRQVCVQMGCIAGFVLNPVKVADMERLQIPYSYSRAWRLGQAVLHARKHKLPPVDTILTHEGGALLGVGKIVDVDRRTEGGFARGTLEIEGFGDFQGQTLHINFQNENLVAKMTCDTETKLLACTPDLISIVAKDTGEPIATEEMRYGLRVAVLCIAAPALLRTERALEVVGPQAFGYPEEEVKYVPFGTSQSFQPIGPV